MGPDTVVVSRTRILRLWLICLALTATRAAALDLSSVYLSWTQFVEQFFDPNTGQTTLNTLLLPIGGNLEGMGTAYTAVARDAGYIESNPSASSRLTYTELSLSHRDVIDDVSLESIVYTMRLGNLGLGVAGKFLPIRFPHYDADGVQVGKAYITESVLILNGSYNIKIDNNFDFEGISVGGNLKAAVRGVPDALLTGLATDLGSQSAVGVMADLGILVRENLLKNYTSRSKNFSAGLALKNLGPPVQGDPLPTMVSLGIGYSVIRPLLFSFDLNIPMALAAGVAWEDLSYALGMDIQVADFLSVQTGLWLRGANPRLSLGASVELATMSLVVNSTLDLSGASGIGDKLSVQARVNLGDRGRGALQTQIDDLFAQAFKAYAAGELENALTLAEKVVSLQGNHKYALKLVDLAKKSIETQQRIRQKQEEASGLVPTGETGTTTIEGGTGTVTPADEGLGN